MTANSSNKKIFDELLIYNNAGDKMIKKISVILCFNILMFCLFSCSSESVNPNTDDAETPNLPNKQYVADHNDGWELASFEEVGLNNKKFDDLISYLTKGTFPKLHSVVIAKSGKLVFEKYFPGEAYATNVYKNFQWDTQHYAASTTKSINSLLIGIAFDKGFFSDINEKLKDFFPNRKEIDWSGDKGEINLKHMLTMSSGLEWDEWSYPFNDPRNSLGQFNQSLDPIGMVLSKDCIYPPGTKFAYNSGCSVVLGEMLRVKTGKNPDEFAKEYLFGPLKITNYNWGKFQGIVHTGGGLFMIPRDLAKIGQVVLDKGLWYNNRIVEEKWIDESTSPLIYPFPGIGYGYQWWIEEFVYESKTLKVKCAEGHGGQYICIIPDYDFVVSMTAGYYNSDPMPILKDIVENYVLESLKK